MNKQEALNLLGLSGDPSSEELKKAYRKMAMKYHPDTNKGNKVSEEKFKKVAEAYEFLKNPQKESFFDFNSATSGPDIFDSFIKNVFSAQFNSRSQRRKKDKPGTNPIKLDDADIGIFNISMNQALFRENIKLKLKVQCVCPDCCSSIVWNPCRMCNQYGIIEKSVKTAQGFIVSNTHKCKLCKGFGWTRAKTCHTCKNSFIYIKSKEVDFKIPESFKIGQRVCLRGKGNESWKAPNGDIYLYPNIVVPNLSSLGDSKKESIKEILSSK